jgi:hypothetical protein
MHGINVKEICNLQMAPMCIPHPTQQFADALDRLASNGGARVESQAFPLKGV